MVVIPFPCLEPITPSRSALRELVRQLCQRYPRLRANPSERGLRKRNRSSPSFGVLVRKKGCMLAFFRSTPYLRTEKVKL
jgi:hypothetical protein